MLSFQFILPKTADVLCSRSTIILSLFDPFSCYSGWTIVLYFVHHVQNITLFSNPFIQKNTSNIYF